MGNSVSLGISIPQPIHQQESSSVAEPLSSKVAHIDFSVDEVEVVQGQSFFQSQFPPVASGRAALLSPEDPDFQPWDIDAPKTDEEVRALAQAVVDVGEYGFMML